MGNKLRFLVCKHCNNIVLLVNDSGVPPMCCGEQMSKYEPNTVDASIEKHMPVVTTDANSISVKIGSVSHPMGSDHHIAFVYVETEHGGQRKYFKTGDEPALSFCFSDDKPVAVYAYCNLHGLWKTAIN